MVLTIKKSEEINNYLKINHKYELEKRVVGFTEAGTNLIGMCK